MKNPYDTGNPYQAISQEARVMGASPVEIVRLLYAGAIERLMRAQMLMKTPYAVLFRQDALLARLAALQGSEGVEARFEEADKTENPDEAQKMFLDIAKEVEDLATGVKRAREYQKAILGAMQIIEGLRGSLVFDDDNPIAPKLESLYLFCLDKASQAHEEQKPEVLDEVLLVLRTLREGWDKVGEA